MSSSTFSAFNLAQLAPPRHVPHLKHPEVLTVGMQPMTGNWLEPATDPAAMRAHKLERRQSLGDAVYAVRPEGLPGAQELARKVRDWVSERGIGSPGPEGLPAGAERSADSSCAEPSTYTESSKSADLPYSSLKEVLWQASLAVHEDLVVMVPEGGSYSLMAASLCSPSHWRLPEKIGRPMARVHDPIPGIHDRITPRIDRIFQNLRVDTPVERYNWSVQAGHSLFAWPSAHSAPIDPKTPLWYRVERQTLTRLPESGALAFTIRVHLDPLESLLGVSDGLPGLFRAIDATPPSLQQYKTFDWLAPALDKYRTLAGEATALG